VAAKYEWLFYSSYAIVESLLFIVGVVVLIFF